MHIVEVRRRNADLGAAMAQMRTWLDIAIELSSRVHSTEQQDRVTHAEEPSAEKTAQFDVDIDLLGHLIGLYPKQTCPTVAPNWAGRYSSIPTGLSPGGHFFFPVQLDGHRLTATIDTGSQLTVITMASARAAGASEAALSRDRLTAMQGVAGDPVASHIHRFGKLDLGGVIVRNPDIVVADIRSADADIVLGMDFPPNSEAFARTRARPGVPGIGSFTEAMTRKERLHV